MVSVAVVMFLATLCNGWNDEDDEGDEMQLANLRDSKFLQDEE